ncbi:hypothetical protein, partial [Escherichia coli]|uniref:hypothetical protein n=1 Tax=Escherichia coli TaxID=562 RepID=UPI0039F0E10D
NPSAFALCGFKSRSGYHGKDKNKIKAISSVVKPPSGGFFVFVFCAMAVEWRWCGDMQKQW